MSDLDKIVREFRLIVLAWYGLQALECVAGAILTFVAMCAILDNAPITGGLFLMLAFATCRAFADCAAKREQARASLRRLLDIRKELRS